MAQLHQSPQHSLGIYIEIISEIALILGQAPLVHKHLEKAIDESQTYMNNAGYSVESKRVVNGVFNQYIRSFHFPNGVERVIGRALKSEELFTEKEFILTYELYKRFANLQLTRLFGMLNLYQVNELHFHELLGMFQNVIQVVPQLQNYLRDQLDFRGGEIASPKEQVREEIQRAFEIWSVLTPIKMEGMVLQPHFSHTRIGIISTKNNYGVKNIPLYSEMRPIMAALNEDLLDKALGTKRGNHFEATDFIYLLIISKLFTVGLEARIGVHEQQISEQQIIRTKEIFQNFRAESKWDYITELRQKICNFMQNKQAVEAEVPKTINPLSNLKIPENALEEALKVVKMFEYNCAICQEECEPIQDTKFLQEDRKAAKKEGSDDDSILSDLSDLSENELSDELDEQEKKEELKQREIKENQEKKAKEILERLVGGQQLDQAGKPYGYGCFVGSHNFIQKSRITKVKEVLKEKFNPADWKLNQGYFYLNKGNFLFHYGCVKPRSKIDQREFSSQIVPQIEFNCILPKKFNSPPLQQYALRNLKTEIYSDAHSSFQFVATLVQHYQFMKSDAKLVDKRDCLDVEQMKKLLPQVPQIIATYITDNAILQVRLNGLADFISNQLKCSVTLALVDNLRRIFEFYKPTLQYPLHFYLDKFPTECKSFQDIMRYGQKLERYVTNIILRYESYDKAAKENVRSLFKTYSQFLLEAKNQEEEMDGEEIEVFELLPLLEVSAALILGRYAMRIKASQLREKLLKEQLKSEDLFQYLWSNVLELEQMSIEDIGAQAASAMFENRLLNDKEIYEMLPGLRAMVLSLSDEQLQLPFIDLPNSFIALQKQNISKICQNCKRVPEKGGICCFCGMIVCIGTDCCRTGSLDQTFFHSRYCSFGTENGQFRIDVISSRQLQRTLSSPYRSKGGMAPGSIAGIFQLNKNGLEGVKKIALEMKINMLSN